MKIKKETLVKICNDPTLFIKVPSFLISILNSSNYKNKLSIIFKMRRTRWFVFWIIILYKHLLNKQQPIQFEVVRSTCWPHSSIDFLVVVQQLIDENWSKKGVLCAFACSLFLPMKKTTSWKWNQLQYVPSASVHHHSSTSEYLCN